MRILVVDDERIQRETLSAILRDQSYDVSMADCVTQAKIELGLGKFDFVITDFKMPDGNGLAVAENARLVNPHCFVFVMTAYADVQSVIDSMRVGVVDYILKPINVDSLIQKVQFLEEHRNLRAELQDLRARSNFNDSELLIGDSEVIRNLRAIIRKVAETNGTVLITGESGTGKEVAARSIHNSGLSSKKRFVGINCAAIPENLIESELFGHRKGSFTGAFQDKEGLFKVANGGTLFLDEIGELPKAMQAKLLRVLQEREYTPIGDTRPQKFDLRLVVATNRKLELEVQNGNFRQDLYYRINVVEIVMPPLRDHKEDIPLLVNHFLEKMIKRLSRRITKFSADSIRLLVDYQWPGNVRELENVVERALILGSQDPIIEPDQLPPNIQILADNKKLMLDESVDQLRLDVALARFSKVHICKVLESVKGDKKDAAKILGLGLSSLYRKLDEFSIGSKSV